MSFYFVTMGWISENGSYLRIELLKEIVVSKLAGEKTCANVYKFYPKPAESVS